MKNKILILIITIMLTINFAGCGKNDTLDNKLPVTNQQNQSQENQVKATQNRENTTNDDYNKFFFKDISSKTQYTYKGTIWGDNILDERNENIDKEGALQVKATLTVSQIAKLSKGNIYKLDFSVNGDKSNTKEKDESISTIENQESITNNTKDNDIVTQKDSNGTKNNKIDQSTNSNTSSQKIDNKDPKSFYGNWELKKVAGYAKVSTGEDKSLIGLKMSFASKIANIGTVVYNNPKYTITIQTQDTMATKFRTNFLKIGVDTESITELDVSNKNGDEAILFIKDNNTLLYTVEGVFYEVKRIS